MANPSAVAKNTNKGNILTFPGRSESIKKPETRKREKGMAITRKIDSNNLFLKENFLEGDDKNFMMFFVP